MKSFGAVLWIERTFGHTGNGYFQNSGNTQPDGRAAQWAHVTEHQHFFLPPIHGEIHHILPNCIRHSGSQDQGTWNIHTVNVMGCPALQKTSLPPFSVQIEYIALNGGDTDIRVGMLHRLNPRSQFLNMKSSIQKSRYETLSFVRFEMVFEQLSFQFSNIVVSEKMFPRNSASIDDFPANNALFKQTFRKPAELGLISLLKRFLW